MSKDVLQLGELKYQKDNEPHSEIVIPTVRSVMKNIFNYTLVRGAKLEHVKTCGDCFRFHFDERPCFTRLMSSVHAHITYYLSSLILGLLCDSG